MHKFSNADVAVVVKLQGQYFVFRSKNADWPNMTEIVSFSEFQRFFALTSYSKTAALVHLIIYRVILSQEENRLGLKTPENRGITPSWQRGRGVTLVRVDRDTDFYMGLP